MEPMTREEMGELVVISCTAINFAGHEESLRASLASLQTDPRYRDWLEEIEVEDYPEIMNRVDEMYGLQLLRPWLNVQVASTRE